MTLTEAYSIIDNIEYPIKRKYLRRQIALLNELNLSENLDKIFKNLKTKKAVSKDNAKLFT